jgi:molybdopterin molybdotransferase
VRLERAIELACEKPMPHRTEHIPLDAAHNRILAVGLHSKVDDPRFDNSAMDGFAVRVSDCHEAGARLRIVGTSKAGGQGLPTVEAGEACRIMTGARVPDGADAIVMVEDTEVRGESVLINGPARTNFIRRRAENLARGQEALPKGVLLGPAELALAATMGHGEIEVVVKPRIAIISTGDELVRAGDELAEGQIYESNSHALASLAEEMGCEANRLDSAPDSLDELRKTLDSLTGHDAIITSGGVSMGDWDLVRRLMEEEGDLVFWRMKVRPGGPPLFGTWKGTPLFGLPGNPVSSQVVFHILLTPWIQHSLGAHPELGPRSSRQVRVRLRNSVKGAEDKLCLRRIRITSEGDELVGSVHTHQGSGNLHSLVAHDGLTLLPPGTDAEAGDFVDALWLR